MKHCNTKKYRWSGMALFVLLLGSLLLLPSCEKEEVNNDPLLFSFGPSSALRGGELRFIGQNLGQVTAVIFPGLTGGSVQVTEIITVNEREIKVVIPQDAGVGVVTLVTPIGEIKTKTPITYSEPISISSVSPLKVKPGETLTIEGDYLNLIKRVIFVDNVAVEAEDFLPGQTRKKLQVVVPAEARTGKIILSNAEEMPIELYAPNDVEVVLPSVTAPADLTNKKPGEVIEIAGKDFDLVVALRMPNGDEVPFEVITNEGSEIIRFTLPANMTDGVVVAVPASGVDVAIANIGLALPANVVATPSTDLRAGDLITLEGLNMELITSLTFPGMTTVVEPESQTATKVTVTMPDAATSGTMLLNTGSGVSVEVAIETLKPTFVAYENSTVPLGDNVVITGINLDLVSKVLFTGGATVEVSNSSSTNLIIAMPTMNVETGNLTLVMANGESVEIESLTIEAPKFAYFPVLPGEEDEPNKGGTVMSIGITNGDKLMGVEVDGTPVQFIINNNLLYFEIPQLANANSKVKLISTNGEIIYSIAFIPATDIEIVIFNTLTDLGPWTDPRVMIPASEFERDIPAEAKLKIYFVQKEAWGQVQINDGWWSNDGIFFPEIGGAHLTTDNAGGKDVKEIELTLTPELVQRFREKGGIVMQGSDWIISKVSIKYQIALEKTVWTGDVDLGSWSINYEVTPNTNFLDADVKAGMTLRIYVDTYGPEPEIQLFHGNWGRIYGDIVIDTTNSAVWNGKCFALPIDAEIASYLREKIDWGYSLIVQGKDCKLKKITIE